ncbi:MAG: EamA family transporter, partial [Chloroflexi bacterium]|nr:EamA family transporter [Chloroflexota bacterium]
MSDRRSAALGSLLALAAASLFAMLGPLSRFAADAGLEGMAFAAWRAGAGAVALGVALAITGRIASGRAQLRALDSRGRAALATAAVMGLVVNVTVFIAFGRITIALALMLFYTYPALVAATEVLLGRDRLTAPKLIALGLASAGVAAVLAGALVVSGDDVTVDGIGVALGLVAAVCQAVFVIVSRSGYAVAAPTTATLVILAVSGLGT